MDTSDFKIERARQWFGWTRRQPSVAVTFRDDSLFMLALRDRPLRITACGAVPLSVGTVRHDELRLVGLAADAMRSLMGHLLLREDAPVVAVVSPVTAWADHGVDSIDATMNRRQIDAISGALQEAGFTRTRLDPVPAALARFGRTVAGSTGFAGGAGWLTGWAGPVSEVSASGTLWDPVTLGVSPTTLLPSTSPLPVKTDSAVTLAGPWQLLLGGALATFAHGPTSGISGVAEPVVSGWAAEPIGSDRP